MGALRRIAWGLVAIATLACGGCADSDAMDGAAALGDAGGDDGTGGGGTGAGAGNAGSGGAGSGGTGGDAGKGGTGGDAGSGGTAGNGGEDAGVSGTGGTGGGDASCGQAGCTNCLYGSAPADDTECYCPLCPSHPMGTEQCEANSKAYNDACTLWLASALCPVPSCIAPPDLACQDGVCVETGSQF